MTITSKTRLCALIGDPVEHSMSPPMHNAAYEELGLDYVYVSLKVEKEHLAEAVNGLRALNIRGFNVTMPHKVSVIPLLDKLNSLAEQIGAVNTVVNDNGVLTGYNTDGPGVLQAMLEEGIEPEDKNAVIIGAGGASRAISFVLARAGAKLTILNRREELDWAENIGASIKQALGTEVKVMELGRNQLETALAGAEILVQATNVGMSPNDKVSLVPAELLKKGLTVFDVIYTPLKTRLIQEAETAGCRIFTGVDMLVWQGVLCFKKWTGKSPSAETMRREAMRMLQKG